MTFEEIVEATKEWHPTVITQATEDYPTLKEGDAVVVYNDNLALVSEDGKTQVIYNDWVGSFENPIPVLELILNENAEDVFVPSLHNSILIVRDDSEEVAPEEDED